MENKCVKCNVTIHPAFLGHHKCGHGNCPVCKDPVLNKQYWSHIRLHPGHENDAPPRKTFDNREKRNTHHLRSTDNTTKKSY
ncbi:MAG TPA: hypothetical protein VEH06_01055 [Candidatus Bathyarchaeia archaeon]|nr:hypothetical protein [Candidatus Bathyarchaeia archaeon]